MSLTEQTRVRLHQYFEEQMGRDVANEVMEWIPRGELATKDDIDALRLATTRDIEGLRLATTREIETLRVSTTRDIEGLRLSMTRDMDALRLEVTKDLEHQGTTLGLRIENTAEKMRTEFHRDTRQHTIVMVGTIVTLNAILASAIRMF